MPYSREHANSYGYEVLITDPFLRERLKSYSFRPVEKSEEEGPADSLKLVKLEDLPSSGKVEDFTTAYAIDGSTAGLDEAYSFEVTAVKLGLVRQDLELRRKISEAQGPIDPSLLAQVASSYTPLALLPGEGVFTDVPGEDLWQDKFRKELSESFGHVRLPSSGASLTDIARRLAPRPKTRCVACQEAGRLTQDENVIQLGDLDAHCHRCYREAHFTDFIFTESWLREGKASGLPLAIMLIMERLLMLGLIREKALAGSLSSTAFFIDGPLALYSTHSLNELILKDLQGLSSTPVLAGLEKTGTYARFARRPDVQEALTPGSVAMVTDEAAAGVKGREEKEAAGGKIYTFGRRFFYRSRDGLRTFVVMIPPAFGSPRTSGLADDKSEDWATYPHLRLICELLEDQTTEAFGPTEAAIDIIAEANHAASLPSRLSPRFLTEVLREEGAPLHLK